MTQEAVRLFAYIPEDRAAHCHDCHVIFHVTLGVCPTCGGDAWNLVRQKKEPVVLPKDDRPGEKT